jgi:hypothetical protein
MKFTDVIAFTPIYNTDAGALQLKQNLLTFFAKLETTVAGQGLLMALDAARTGSGKLTLAYDPARDRAATVPGIIVFGPSDVKDDLPGQRMRVRLGDSGVQTASRVENTWLHELVHLIRSSWSSPYEKFLVEDIYSRAEEAFTKGTISAATFDHITSPLNGIRDEERYVETLADQLGRDIFGPQWGLKSDYYRYFQKIRGHYIN